MDSNKKNTEQAITEILLTLYRYVHELRAGEQAMMRIIGELKPHLSNDAAAALLSYADYKNEISQAMLLELEKINPWFAAQLDKQRPLISPDEQGE